MVVAMGGDGMGFVKGGRLVFMCVRMRIGIDVPIKGLLE